MQHPDHKAARIATPRASNCLSALASVLVPATILFACAACEGATLVFQDYNNQDSYNRFSGDWAAFSGGSPATITTSFATNTFIGSNGASLRIDYSVPTGYVGIWNSLLGKISFTNLFLNFNNLYGGLKNSTGHVSHVEGVHLTNFSFFARGNGQGSRNHTVRFEFKDVANRTAGTLIAYITNTIAWTKYSWNPMHYIPAQAASNMKAINWIINALDNSNRSDYFYIDHIVFDTDEPSCNPSGWSDDQFLDLVGHRAFAYFYRFTDKRGFVHDRSTFSDLVNVGGIGFQLAAYCIGHKRGWADGLENRVLTILTNLAALPMGAAPGTNTAGNRGFFFHFLDANTGLRNDTRVEVSVYDTILLKYGALAAKAYFPSNAQIQAAARQLCDRIEWTWMVDITPGPISNRLHRAWVPEPSPGESFRDHVDGYTDEALLTYVMALGSTNYTVPTQIFYAQNRTTGA